MDTEILEQARLIHQTVMQLRTRMISQHMRFKVSSGMNHESHELTIPQVNMLRVIRERDGITIKDLAAALNVSAPSASAMVERLVEIGAATREQNPDDRREVTVSVSREALQIIDEIESRILQRIVDLLERIGPRYARQWSEAFAKILDILAQENAVQPAACREKE